MAGRLTFLSPGQDEQVDYGWASDLFVSSEDGMAVAVGKIGFRRSIRLHFIGRKKRVS